MSRNTDFRFLIKPNWLAAHVLVIALALTLSALGFWQLDRLEQSQNRNKMIENRQHQKAISVDEIDSAESLSDLEYSKLILFGHYDPINEVLLRGRSYAGQAGYNLFTPFVLTNNKVVMVERGWLPIQYNKPPVLTALPPTGYTQIVGTLRLSTDTPSGWNAFLAPKDPPGKLTISAYTDLKRLEQQMPYKLEPYYLRLLEQKPKQDKNLPYPLLPVKTDNGSHLSYAMQWFSFVIIGLAGYALIIRKRFLSNP